MPLVDFYLIDVNIVLLIVINVLGFLSLFLQHNNLVFTLKDLIIWLILKITNHEIK